MSELTTDQWVAQLHKVTEKLSKENLPLKKAATTTEAFRVVRVFQDGKNQNGAGIGTYNTTTEIWASNDQLRKKGTNKGKTGKPTKSSYYKNYKSLVAQQGLDSSGVHLRMTNNFQSDYANAPLAKGSNGVPKPKPFRVNVNTYVVKLSRQENVDKLRGFESKYGKVFDFSNDERKLFNKVYNFEANQILEGKK